MNDFSKYAYNKLALSAVACAFLVACGGGGGGGSATGGTTPVTPAPTVAFDAAAAQGRWIQGDLTALVLPAQAGAAEVWMVNQTPTSLYKYEVASTGKLTGYKYPLTGSGVRENLSGDVTLTTSTTPKTLSFANSTLSVYTLSLSDALSGASSLADVAGNWTFTVNQGAVKFDATISATGAFAASTVSDDCTYAGQLSNTSAATVYKISYQSTCQGVVSSMSGVARWVSASNALAILAASADGQSGSLISMKKP